ncbi:hemin receptor [Prevotella sp. oral taxon 376]|uniref:OmpP1/FadL family transporter n=1 Tax=Prevotella sp. oral taxon 376 TaxID=712466 RepID=UPI000D1E483F|nr:hemin receptor [Prevotella sp. oral taxon 376]PTL34475.1 hemin receptor [Prevotella sp. oral taxon 376]
MKTKYLLIAALVFPVMPMAAQETYQDTKLIGNELNGTARYVGMGGAMEGLGADLSTMSTNPAGIGLFRSNQISLSAGLVAQTGESTNISGNGINAKIKGDKVNASFDQIGFVWVNRTGYKSFLNLGFNYHKSRNFDQILTTTGALQNASQNKLSAIKYSMVGKGAWNGVDANYEKILTKEGAGGKKYMDYYDATAYAFGQYQKGYIGEYDFTVSGNIKDRWYLGLTFGLHDVNYRSNSYYTENLAEVPGSPVQPKTSEAWEDLKITGTGFDVKAGVIFRPVEESPFRIGLYVNTPVFYDLSMKGYSDVTMTDEQGHIDQGNSATYDYKVYTPWKFGFGLGHTVGSYLALGATYEYSDYSTIDNRINDGGYYDAWYGSYYEESSSDGNMNAHTKATLKGVHTLKLGLEYKPIQPLSLRLGYNFVSAVFKEDGFRDGSIVSPGTAYATSTDYTNWKSTNRFTLGIGYQIKKFSIDLAYQYSQTDGEFFPFMSYYAQNASESNVVKKSDVSFKRNQLLLTFGYRF